MSGFSKKYQYEEAQKAGLLADIRVGDLVKVIKFDPKAMTLDVKPITQRLTGGEYAGPSQVLKVPITGIRSGGFLYRPWFREGDVGAAQYMDNDIDKPLETGDECKPNTERHHSDSDMMFHGGVVAGGWECPDLPEGLALATEDGAIFLVITKDKILIQGDVIMDGNLTVNGNITVNGGDVVADGISLKKHTHQCPHGGSTSPPQ